MSHQTEMPKALRFDFRMKFYVSRILNYKDFWSNPAWVMVTGSSDFTDWGGASLGIVSDPEFAFYDCTNNFVAIDINHFSQGALATWSINLTGHGYDMSLFAKDRLFVCTMQFDYLSSGGVWTTTPEGIGFIGRIRSTAPALSPKINGEFTISVGGIGSYLNDYFMQVRSWGKINIAKGKSCAWSSTLAEPSLLYNSGEFVGTQVTLGPENAVDGVLFGPPAVSAVPPAGTDLIRTISGDGYIREVYMWPPVGYGDEYQWISVSSNIRFMMSKGYGSYKAHVGDDENHTTWWSYDTPYPMAPSTVTANGVGVFCYSRKRVEEFFDLGDTEWVVEWGDKVAHKLSRTEDFLSVGNGNTHRSHKDGVYWSTNSSYKPSITVNENGTDGGNHPIFEWRSGGPWYTPPAIDPTTIPPGNSIARRIWHVENGGYWELEKDTDTPGDWMVTDLPSPVCWVDTDSWKHDLKGPLDEAQYQWGLLNLGQMSCLLDVNYDPTTAPSTMYLQNTLGLSYSGTGIVNNQKFTYSSKTSETIAVTEWLGSVVTVVGAGSAVYQYDDVIDEIRTGYCIREIVLWRKPKRSHIQRGSLYGSIYDGALFLPNSEEDDWWSEWQGIGDQKRGLQLRPGLDSVDTGKYVIDLGYNPDRPEQNRFVQLLILCEAMRGNEHIYPATSPLLIESGGLFMLNEIEVFLNEVSTKKLETIGEPQPSDDYTDGKGTVGKLNTIARIISEILSDDLGFPITRIEVDSLVNKIGMSSQTTARSTFASVLSELLYSYGVIMVESMQGTLKLRPNPWFRPLSDTAFQASYPAFGQSELSSVSIDYAGKRLISQARISCRDADGHSTFIGVYPKSQEGFGELIDGGGNVMIAPDQDHANLLAESIYKQESNQDTATFTVSGSCTWIKPFDIVSLVWPLTGEPDASIYGTESLWLVRSVSHRVNLGTPSSGAKPSEKNWVTTFECQSTQRQTVRFY